MGLLKQIICTHSNVVFVRKTYGDENNTAIDLGGRYIWRCLDCGQLVNKPYGPTPPSDPRAPGQGGTVLG